MGRYLEWLLGTLNDNLGTPIPYKVSNSHTLGEHYDPLVKRLRSKLKRPPRTHKLIECFQRLEQGEIFRNYCMHWKDEATPLSTPEVTEIYEKWLTIETFIFCEGCKSFISFQDKGGQEYIRCNCGQLDLKDDVHFEVSC
jgi:hypothetical protein